MPLGACPAAASVGFDQRPVQKQDREASLKNLFQHWREENLPPWVAVRSLVQVDPPASAQRCCPKKHRSWQSCTQIASLPWFPATTYMISYANRYTCHHTKRDPVLHTACLTRAFTTKLALGPSIGAVLLVVGVLLNGRMMPLET